MSRAALDYSGIDRHQEWLNQRREYVGSSDTAAVLGLSPYKTALDVYLEKRGLVEMDESTSEAAHWGNVMEPVLCGEYARRRNEDGEQVAVVHHNDRDGALTAYGPRGECRPLPAPPASIQSLVGGIRHPEFPFIRCHMDGLVLGQFNALLRGLECKTADLHLLREWGDAEESDEVPERYLVQTQHVMAVVPQVDVMDVAVLIGGNRFRTYRVERDDVLIRALVDRLREFWDRVQAGDPPPAPPTELGRASLARLYPSDNDASIPAGPEHLPLLRDLVRARAAEKAAEREKLRAENELKQLLGAAARLEIDRKNYVSWKRCRDGLAIDYEAMSAELFEMLAMDVADRSALLGRFTTTTPGSRRFLVKLDNWKGAHDGE